MPDWGQMIDRSDPDTSAELTADQVEAISRVIADPRRFAMLQQIARQPAVACTGLHLKAHLSPATISHHLKELQSVGLVQAEREGRGLRLSLRRDVWNAYLRQLASL